MYNWQNENWPNFEYHIEKIGANALRVASLVGEIQGTAKIFDNSKLRDQVVEMITSEAVKTSAIEGEMLSREEVRSSLLKKFGLATTTAKIDRRAENVATMMMAVRKSATLALTEELLKQWHEMLFSNDKYTNAGVFRCSKEQMLIVSGAFGNEKVHFEAPPSERVPAEMAKFVTWFNKFETEGNWQKIIAKTAIAHLYFESIHPFEDGNGRIGRAIIEKSLFESFEKPLLISVSQAIDVDRKRYYNELKNAQSSLNVDSWIAYFADLLIVALNYTIEILQQSVRKMHFFAKYGELLNERQTKALNKMFDAGVEGFEGGMTTKKYISITRAPKTTAVRDLQKLVELGIFEQNEAGRNTHYKLIFEA